LLSGVVESNAVALDGNDLSGGDLYVEDLPVGGGIDGLQAKGLEREIDSVLVGRDQLDRLAAQRDDLPVGGGEQ